MKKTFAHLITFLLFFTLTYSASGIFFPELAFAQEAKGSCSFSRDFSIEACAMKAVGWVAIMFLQIVSLLTQICGVLLNYVIKYTIVDATQNYEKIPAINVAWKTIRDLGNMGFIFMLLYASIKLIIGEGKDTRKIIVNMVIAALLINFSLFFTKIIIDASNLLTLTFYNAIAPGASDSVISRGLSNAMMKPLNLGTIWQLSGDTAITGTKLIIIGIMGSIFSLIAALVFFAVAIMFIVRYVILIIVLILSPIYFLSNVLPGLDSIKKQWLGALGSQTLFAPIYMMMTWITISIINSVGFTGGSLKEVFTPGGTGNAALASSAGSIGLVFNFIIVIGFLVASLIISKSVAGKASGGATKWAMNMAGGATLGMAGRAGRGTFGRYGQAKAEDKDLNARALAGSKIARLQLAAAKRMGTASYDARGTKAVQSLGLDLGKAKSGGFAKDVENKNKKLQEYVKGAKGLTDKEKERNDEEQKVLKASHESAITNFDAAEKTAREEAERTITKTPEHLAAEKAEQEAERNMAIKSLSDTPEDIAKKQEAYKNAKKERERLEEIHNENKRRFIGGQTMIQKSHVEMSKNALDAAKKRGGETGKIDEVIEKREKKIKKLKSRWFRPSTDKVFFFGRTIKREDEGAPDVIRKAIKKKSAEEEAVDALKKIRPEEQKPAAEEPEKPKTT